MRLINITHMTDFCFEEFFEPEVPKYAILSHTWTSQEVSYQDFCNFKGVFKMNTTYHSSISEDVTYEDFCKNWTPDRISFTKSGYSKIFRFAIYARIALKLNYIWVDTCCIDKSSSAELSEAINSMFRWYRDATVCCVYLEDVRDQPNSGLNLPKNWTDHFRKSRWFTRGWTLQELIAPRRLIFFSKDWVKFENQYSLHPFICAQTRIPWDAIQAFPGSDHGTEILGLSRFSTAQKMSWAAGRKTTRIEDRAYSLLGIFDINMPMLYGEGDRAFLRLQEELLKASTDYSMFCWNSTISHPLAWRGLLAKDPSEFENSKDLVQHDYITTLPLEQTNKGIRITAKLGPNSGQQGRLALLNCGNNISGRACGMWVQKVHDDVYVRVQPHALVEIPSRALSNHMAVCPLETIFIKPDVTKQIWNRCESCSTLSGFRFLPFQDPKNNIMTPFPWVDDVSPEDHFDWASGQFTFNFDSASEQRQIATAKCLLSLYDAKFEVWIRFDTARTYGGASMLKNKQQDSTWIMSQCCEWKLLRASCEFHDLDLTSWIALDRKGRAFINIDFHDRQFERETRDGDWEHECDEPQDDEWELYVRSHRTETGNMNVRSYITETGNMNVWNYIVI